MNQNFQFIGGFGVSDKELNQGKKSIPGIISEFTNNGITEFFVGYNPYYWYDKYGFEVSPNGRFGENEQITSYKTLDAVVDHIHRLKNKEGKPCEVFLAVNGRYYTATSMELLKRIIDEGIKTNVDGFIVGSVEVLEYLASIKYQGKIHISTILSIYNVDAIEFLIDVCKSYGLKLGRIILPREVSLEEIKDITSNFPDLNFEVFGEGDYCRYANGNCLAEHKYYSRDICTFALNQGLEVEKRVKSDFRRVILDKSLTDAQKQAHLDNRLKDIQDIFVQQVVSPKNTENNIMQNYINKFVFNENTTKSQEYANTIFPLMQKELILNFHKYIHDGLLDTNSLHNKNITNFLTLYKLMLPFLKDEYKNNQMVKERIAIITSLKKYGEYYFTNLLREKGQYGIETYYKFMLYNRTSIPAYHILNNIKNVKVVKIPLRGRDVGSSTMKLQIVQDAIQNPSKYLDISNISGKYFHYDLSNTKEYIDKLKELVQKKF